jgi:hypothetical protein
VLEDGRLIEVVAAPEPLVEIRGADPHHLVRIAWHLGNRHLPTQIVGKGLRIRRDHVIEDMVRGLGARVIAIEAPFDPEGGAYAAAVMPDIAMTITTTAITSTATITRIMVTPTIVMTIIMIMTSMTTIITTVTAMLMTTGTDRDTHALPLRRKNRLRCSG